MNKDTIVGIAGAAILVAAMAGVFWYEGSQGPGALGARTFSVSFADAEPANGPGTTGTATEGTPDEKTVRLTGGNWTVVEFALVWTDDVGSPDTFRFTVAGPSGIAAQTSPDTPNGPNNRGEVKLVFRLGERPTATAVSANSAEQAEERAMAQSARTLGVGEWTITVELVDAGDLVPQVPLPGNLPVNPVADSSNAYEIKTILTAYVANAS